MKHKEDAEAMVVANLSPKLDDRDTNIRAEMSRLDDEDEEGYPIPDYLNDKEAAMRVFNNLSTGMMWRVIQNIQTRKYGVPSHLSDITISDIVSIMNFTAREICQGIMDAYGIPVGQLITPRDDGDEDEDQVSPGHPPGNTEEIPF